MSEQDDTQFSSKQRRSRKANTPYQYYGKVYSDYGKQYSAAPRPIYEDKEAWIAYWKAQGQPWRIEPEIDNERKKYLAKRRTVEPDIEKGIYPFKGIKLNRADVEWLLATHEKGQGPVDWDDESQRNRKGLDLRFAKLSFERLSGLPLNKCALDFAQLKGALLFSTQLNGSTLTVAQLRGAFLNYAELNKADLTAAKLQGATLSEAQLLGAHLSGAELQGANMSAVILTDADHIGPHLADVEWGETNIAVVDWSQIAVLGEEDEAENGDFFKRGFALNDAMRAYRQLSIVLRNQGLNEDSARFAYRAQLMQRKLYARRFRVLQYLGSLFLDFLAGYGYKPLRSFRAYLLVVTVFATIYHLLGTHLAWNEAIVISMTAFHGRGFFPDQFHPGDPQALVAAIEAFVGLLIEVTFIATLTQRLFGK